MPTFTPPVVSDRPAILPETEGIQRQLYKFMANRKRYVNVFKLSDGTYVQDTPTTENTNVNIPYPWDPNNPSGPYSTSYYHDYTLKKDVVSTVSNNPYIVLMYSGPTVVTSAEAALLTTAGYGADIV